MARVRDNNEEAPPLVGTRAFFAVYADEHGLTHCMPFVAFQEHFHRRADGLLRLLEQETGRLRVRSLEMFIDHGSKRRGYADAAETLASAFR